MFIVDAWQPDGPNGESAIATLRCASRAEFADFVKRYSQHKDCVLITKSRSDKRSLYFEVLYVRPGYSSGTTPPGTKAERPTNRGGRKPKDEIGLCPTCGQRISK